jgi:hypothetical protein
MPTIQEEIDSFMKTYDNAIVETKNWIEIEVTLQTLKWEEIRKEINKRKEGRR